MEATIDPLASRESSRLRGILEEVTHLLPQQGPVSVFVHHNTLHAFEHLPFEEAVVVAGRQFGCEPFLPEERYRDELRAGRISIADVEALLKKELGGDGEQEVANGLSRFELWRRVAIHGFMKASGDTLNWLLTETPVLSRAREDLPAATRVESSEVTALWTACLTAARSTDEASRETSPPHRERDLLFDACGIDTDGWIHPLLIRFVSAYLDQGIARVSMPHRELGMRACFHRIYGSPVIGLAGRWARRLPSIIAADREHDDPLESIRASLDALGVPQSDWGDKLIETALALRGWAGMVHQVEQRPDRVPTVAVPATLPDFLAVRLLMERAALSHAAQEFVGFSGPTAGLRSHLRERWTPPAAPTSTDRAWPIFQVAQLCGLASADVAAMGTAGFASLEAELSRFHEVERRRVLHLAYEQHFRHRLFHALVDTPASPPPEEPVFQAVFCIDDREESIRRHLEEADPEVETFGAAGFYGVAMYYQGVHEAHARPLCPVSIHPDHFVREVADEAPPIHAAWRSVRRQGVGVASQTSLVGSRSIGGGALMSLLGVFALIPLVLRVVFPRLARRVAHTNLLSVQHTHLALERTDEAPAVGKFNGYTVDEMAAIVRGMLTSMGIAHRLSPLVFVLGHCSASLNNPMESAHECGACAGAPGGPNGRAFAEMANDPRVRDVLAEQGFRIPGGTWFIGGERNTSSSAVTFFDMARLPEAHLQTFERAKKAFQRARENEAHERSRRFEALPTWAGPRLALRHVEARSVDLAQPRPEFGHATNAICIVGRRSRTTRLFLDRRAFLVSYDPTTDEDGAILAGLLGAVVPVCAGINLEYYFSYVDSAGYGCGTKLPHNITSLLGVMDGAQSDLRPGLPWEMVEIHEPVRLSMVVEADPTVVAGVLAQSAELRRLVENRWLFVACLDPDDQVLREWTLDGFVRFEAEQQPHDGYRDSAAVYAGKRGHLGFEQLRGAEAEVVP